jgi:periplasmic protein TonB
MAGESNRRAPAGVRPAAAAAPGVSPTALIIPLAPHYRSYGLPWEADAEEQQRVRRLFVVGLLILLLFGLVLPIIHLPPIVEAPSEAVPQRLARLMVQEKPKPPAPVVRPKPAAKPVPKPVVVPKPVDQAVQARLRAQHAIQAVQDQLADLRQQMDPAALGQIRNLQGAVGQDSHAERSLITSRAGAGSGAYVTTASASRGFGSGAGALTGHQAAQVTSRIAQAAAASHVNRGSSGRASRSEEEIALVFDRNKSAIYALYGRALREQPDLQGKLVLQFTIAPSGEVTECHVVSSELHDPDLERKIVALVELFRFEPKDVAAITTTKPIEFVPAG